MKLEIVLTCLFVYQSIINEDLEFETDVFTNLSQYECDVCADEHYHTKQNVRGQVHHNSSKTRI